MIQILQDRGRPCTAEEADILRDEINRLYGVASELRVPKKETDLERFLGFYRSLGAGDSEITIEPTCDDAIPVYGEGTMVTINPKGKCFEGYGCFYSTIFFDTNGKFVKQGFWE